MQSRRARELNTTVPWARPGIPVSLSVALTPCGTSVDDRPFTAMVKAVESGVTVNETVFVEVDPMNFPSVSLKIAEIGE